MATKKKTTPKAKRRTVPKIPKKDTLPERFERVSSTETGKQLIKARGTGGHVQ